VAGVPTNEPTRVKRIEAVTHKLTSKEAVSKNEKYCETFLCERKGYQIAELRFKDKKNKMVVLNRFKIGIWLVYSLEIA
jgi:hypothetical protein